MQDIIDKIHDLSIESVIGKELTLEKSGSKLKGCCPFHNEKTASFVVSPGRNSFHCFGCGEHGDAISFIQKFHKLGFMEAVEHICKDHKIEFNRKQFTPQDEETVILKEQLVMINQNAARFYHDRLKFGFDKYFSYAFNRIPDWSLLNQFQIGVSYDSWNDYLTYARSIGIKEEFLLKSSLIAESEKNKSLYDFFRNRLIFPIHDQFGRPVAFAGRSYPWEKEKTAKYVNSPETPVYNKSRTLYGLCFARKAIAEKGVANIVEGYLDVISMHMAGYCNTVAPCGTALTEDQVSLLKKYTGQVNLVYDADKAGWKAVARNSLMFLREGFRVSVTMLPDTEDPDTFFKPFEINTPEFIETKTRSLKSQDYVTWFCTNEMEGAGTDPELRAEAIDKVTGLLAEIPDPVKVQSYSNWLATTYKKEGLTKKLLLDTIKKHQMDPDTEKAIELDTENLPKYVDKRKYVKYQFYQSEEGIEKNQLYFRSGGRITNFVMRPLFHIESINDTRKLFEIENKYGDKQVIELDMQAMVSLMTFKKAIESRGNFLWEGNDIHFTYLKRWLYDETRYCRKIDRLGWQEQGFWAWANGISTTDGVFTPIDMNGIVEYEKKHYFIQAFSSIYLSDKSIFKDERRFVYVDRKDITLHSWAEKFLQVYGDQARLTICFYLTSVFSDFIFYKLTNLPVLNIFGQKGTGKNEQAMSILCLFGRPQNELQLHNATKPGISAHLEQFINALIWVDEYKNSLPIEYIESLKAIYNRNGRTRGSIREGVSKEQTPIDSMVMITGQEMMTADVALLSRAVFLHYHDTEHSQEQKENLEKLHEIQAEGLSHFTHMLIRNRDYLEKNYAYAFNEVQADLTTRAGKSQYDDRIMRNLITIVATFKTLQNLVDLPFTYEDLLQTAMESIAYQNQLLSNANELSQFWAMIETLLEKDLIKSPNNFRIEFVSDLALTIGTKAVTKVFKPPKQVLFLKWSGIYQLYAEYSRRAGQNPLPTNTLVYYLETSKPYLGKKKSVRFDRDINQAMCFDYDLLSINLIRYHANDENSPKDDIKAVIPDNSQFQADNAENTPKDDIKAVSPGNAESQSDNQSDIPFEVITEDAPF